MSGGRYSEPLLLQAVGYLTTQLDAAQKQTVAHATADLRAIGASAIGMRVDMVKDEIDGLLDGLGIKQAVLSALRAEQRRRRRDGG